MNSVLENALSSLTSRVNLATGLTHPLDMDSAKEMFKILHENQIPLTATEIEQWAVNHGWEATDARELGNLGQRIGDGGRVQIKNKNCWGSAPFTKWQSAN